MKQNAIINQYARTREIRKERFFEGRGLRAPLAYGKFRGMPPTTAIEKYQSLGNFNLTREAITVIYSGNLMTRNTRMSSIMIARLAILIFSLLCMGALLPAILMEKLPPLFVSILFPLIGTSIAMVMILVKGDNYDSKGT
jgi:hypothetical protein